MLLVLLDEEVVGWGAMILGAVGRAAEVAGRLGWAELEDDDGPAMGGADGPAAAAEEAAATLALFVGLGCTTFGLAGRDACAAWSLMVVSCVEVV